MSNTERRIHKDSININMNIPRQHRGTERASRGGAHKHSAKGLMARLCEEPGKPVRKTETKEDADKKHMETR